MGHGIRNDSELLRRLQSQSVRVVRSKILRMPMGNVFYRPVLVGRPPALEATSRVTGRAVFKDAREEVKSDAILYASVEGYANCSCAVSHPICCSNSRMKYPQTGQCELV